jgi:hypothetical protein
MSLNMLDTLRCLERVSYHTWRIYHYLGGNGTPETTAAAMETRPNATAGIEA